MSTQRKVIIFVAGLVILIIALWLIIFRPAPPPERTNQAQLGEILEALSEPAELAPLETSGNGAPAAAQDSGRRPIVERLVPLNTLELEAQELEILVRDFVERWGSFSNQNDFASILELKDLMTSRLQEYSDTYINDLRQEHPYAQGYFGITTQAAVIELEPLQSQASSLSALVKTRRQESTDTSTRDYSQDIELELFRVGERWLVAGVYWQQPE